MRILKGFNLPEKSEQHLIERVRAAAGARAPLAIVGGGSKNFYGREIIGEALSTLAHRGIVEYDPSELVVSVKAGTPLAELQNALREHGQMLGFEPPTFGGEATIGGAVASGLAGCARPYQGGVRDFILGVKILTGEGEVMQFGGRVMKNVAGFDHARLMAGALGTLGMLLEVSLRVVPLPESEVTLQIPHATAAACVSWLGEIAARPLPLTAAAWCDGVTRLRLSGSHAGVENAAQALANDADAARDDAGAAFWRDLTNLQLPFFDDARVVRVSIDACNPLLLADDMLVDWGGAQRWMVGARDLPAMREQIADCHAHASWFKGGARQDEVFQPLPLAMMRIHKKLKVAFDPHAILNRGRMYRDM